ATQHRQLVCVLSARVTIQVGGVPLARLHDSTYGIEARRYISLYTSHHPNRVSRTNKGVKIAVKKFKKLVNVEESTLLVTGLVRCFTGAASEESCSLAGIPNTICENC
ncbi:unnamed protein product, partial [Caenorhabditis auriculariae]